MHRQGDKDDTAKDAFYDKLEVLYNRCPRSDIKMLVDDFDAKVFLFLSFIVFKCFIVLCDMKYC